MAAKRGSGGRTSKGPRESLISRVPVPYAHLVRDAADDEGLSVSDYIGNVLAARLGLPPVAAPPTAADQLKLTG